MGDDLPLTTKVPTAGASADFVTNNWLVILIVRSGGMHGSACGSGSRLRAVRRHARQIPAVAARDRLRVIKKATISRFARVLGTLVYGGVPILEALEIAGPFRQQSVSF